MGKSWRKKSYIWFWVIIKFFLIYLMISLPLLYFLQSSSYTIAFWASSQRHFYRRLPQQHQSNFHAICWAGSNDPKWEHSYKIRENLSCEYSRVFDVSTPELIRLPEDILIILYVCRLDIVDEVKGEYLLVLIKHVFWLCRLPCAFFED